MKDRVGRLRRRKLGLPYLASLGDLKISLQIYIELTGINKMAPYRLTFVSFRKTFGVKHHRQPATRIDDRVATGLFLTDTKCDWIEMELLLFLSALV